MTNRNCFADEARLAQIVEHETFNFPNYFQLFPVLFSCAVSDFLYEEFSAMPIRAKITLMPFSMRKFLLILFVLLRININDKTKMLC